jgi:hypothetical protein
LQMNSEKKEKEEELQLINIAGTQTELLL